MLRLTKLPKGFPGKPPQRPAKPRSPRKPGERASGAPEPAEREIQRAVVAYLESLGCVVIRINSGAAKAEGRYTRFNSLPGCPDLLAALPMKWEPGQSARFLAIEVKSRRGKTTPLQDDAQQRLRYAGAVVIVARSIDDVRTALIEEGLLK